MSPESARRPGEEASNEGSGAGEHNDHGIVGTPSAGSRAHAAFGGAGASLEAFLACLFPEGSPGKIEVRLFAESLPKGIKDRHWFSSGRELVAALPRLNDQAKRMTTSVCFGVLPRRTEDAGKSTDTIDGWTAWVDLDFKDFANGETEARQRLAEFPLQSSIVVRSGHGLHAYWLVAEATASQRLSQASKQLAQALGGDHAFDAARLLRLPGTINRKDPEALVPVEIEVLDAGRRLAIGTLEEELERIVGCPATGASAAPTDAPEFSIPDELPERIRELIDRNPRIANHFIGKGKPEAGPDGKPLDRSSSGYDHSLVLALIRAGVGDPSELGAALWHRPDGKARAKGPRYIHRTVHDALRRLVEKVEGALEAALDFKVSRLHIFKCNPAIYEFTIEGQTVRLSSSELRSASKFSTAFLDALHRIPQVPTKREDWAALVNLWLSRAERVELPPEASDDLALREDIERTIADLPVGEEREDLDQGKALLLDGQTRVFKAKAVLRQLRDDHPHLGRGVLCKILRDLGFQDCTDRIDGEPTRVWGRTVVTSDNAREEKL